MDGEALAATIQGAQRGDAASFDRLVDQYSGRVFGFLYRLTGSRDAAEDLMQEVFVRVVRMIAAYQHDGRFESWIFRIAANLFRDRVRRSKRGPKHIALDTGDADSSEDGGGPGRTMADLVVDEAEPDARMAQREDLDALGRALSRLPDAERTVIMLRHFSQMSFKEIAEATGTPLGTALARAHRALGRLKELMGVEMRAKSPERAAEVSES